MKYKVIRHLIRLIWLVFMGKLVFHNIVLNCNEWSISLYTRKYWIKKCWVIDED